MMEPTSTDEYLTVAEIADLLKVNQQTVRNWIDDGALAAVRVGARRVRVRRIDLDAYLAAGRTTQRAVRLSIEAEARTALRYAMAQTGAALDGESNTDLA